MPSSSSEYTSAMLVCAHPDDGEFMAAGTLAKFAKVGKEVYYVVCTSGDKGSSDTNITNAELADIRENEQREAAKIVGAKNVVFLKYPDNRLQNTINLRMAITRQIRILQPDMVICMDPAMFYSDRGLYHPDHRAAGSATLEAIFPSARDYHAFPELIAEGLMPHKVRAVMICGASTNHNHFEDVTDTFDTKLKALKAHKSQVGTQPQRLSDFESNLRQYYSSIGLPNGMSYAEGFRLITLS